MKVISILILGILLSGGAFADSSLESKGILSKGAIPKVIAEGLKFSEGPIWLPEKKMLIVSDVAANTQYSWTEKEGLRVYKQPSGFTNGNILDTKGNIISARHDRTIARALQNGDIEVLASTYEGKKLNSPNDLTLYKDGSIYFTDPQFGIIGFGPEKAPEEQPYRGVYHLDKAGKLTRVGQELGMPNGLAFSPDYKTLYVSNSADGNIYKYDVQGDGQLKNLRLFAIQKVPVGQDPVADGIKVDKKGNVYSSSAEGVVVYSPDAQYLGVIALHSPATNLNFGGDDKKTLFITARDKIYRIETAIGQ